MASSGNALALLMRDPSVDPATLSYPPTLPVEIALRSYPVADVCAAYGIDAAEWARLRTDPLFVEDLKFWIVELRKEGMSFKVKARLQSDEMLKRIWVMTHESFDKVPPAVQADLAKAVIRFAGLDGSKDQAAQAANTNALQIVINLGP